MTFGEGGFFEGAWVQGRPEGYGKEVRADGTVYHEGAWAAGVPERDPEAQAQAFKAKKSAEAAAARAKRGGSIAGWMGRRGTATEPELPEEGGAKGAPARCPH